MGLEARSPLLSSRKTGAGGRKRKEDPKGRPGRLGDRTCSAPAVLPQVKQNLLSVSYHIAQYTSIIADLRGEIQRLKCKIDEQGRRGQARGRLERGDIRYIQGTCMGLCQQEFVSCSPPRLSDCSGVRQCWVQNQTLAG